MLDAMSQIIQDFFFYFSLFFLDCLKRLSFEQLLDETNNHPGAIKPLTAWTSQTRTIVDFSP